MQSWSYAMLSQRLQTTLHRKKFRQFRQCRLSNIWSLSLHMYISGPSHQKTVKVMPSLLRKSAETNAETAARHSTQQPVKLLVGHYLKK